jgi:hypothetical protein
MKMSRPFFVVWNPDGRTPTKPHNNFWEAEAQRLATANEGHQFIVLGSYTAFAVSKVQKTDLVANPDQDEIPF